MMAEITLDCVMLALLIIALICQFKVNNKNGRENRLLEARLDACEKKLDEYREWEECYELQQGALEELKDND